MEGSFAFATEVIHEFPSAAELALIDKENEKLLRASAFWHESAIEAEEPDHVSIELRRQDLKISLLLDLVSELILSQSELPAAQSIRLTAKGIEFSDATNNFRSGDKIRSSLYLLPALPRALKFCGNLISSDREGFLIMRFEGTSVAVRDQIEKIIFTNHRRSIAQENADSKTKVV